MKSENVFLALFLLLTILSLGCSTIDPTTGREKLNYFSARCYDFLDMFELNLGFDSEFSLYVVAGVEPIAVGGGLYECEKIGSDGRLLGQWTEKRLEIGLGAESFIRYKKVPNWGNRYLWDAYYCPHENTLEGDGKFYEAWGLSPRLFDHERRFLDITAEVHVIAIALDVGVSMVEILDFLSGIMGFDVISDDDWVSPLPERKIPFFEDEEAEEAMIAVEGN